MGKKSGKFIALEGIDGSGKSTQSALLSEALSAHGISCVNTREPTDMPVGRLLRSVLKGEVRLDARAVAPLFAADRIDHLTNEENGILKLVESGITVICDRYYFSSFAYHSVDIPLELVISENTISRGLLKPDLTLFIDISPEEAMRRINAGRESTELFESLERLTAVRENYMKSFRHFEGEERVAVINGEAPPERVAAEVLKAVMEVL